MYGNIGVNCFCSAVPACVFFFGYEIRLAFVGEDRDSA